MGGLLRAIPIEIKNEQRFLNIFARFIAQYSEIDRLNITCLDQVFDFSKTPCSRNRCATAEAPICTASMAKIFELSLS